MDKYCPGCETTKPVADFGRDSSRPDGLFSYCRICAREYSRERRAVLIASRVAKPAAKRSKCRKCKTVKLAKWFYFDASRKNGLSAYCRRCTTEIQRTTYPKYAERYRDAVKKRKAAKRGATVEIVNRRKVWERDDGVCHICGDPVAYKEMHLDHVKPLSRGGDHSYANCKAAHGPCNLRKGDKILSELVNI